MISGDQDKVFLAKIQSSMCGAILTLLMPQWTPPYSDGSSACSGDAFHQHRMGILTILKEDRMAQNSGPENCKRTCFTLLKTEALEKACLSAGRMLLWPSTFSQVEGQSNICLLHSRIKACHCLKWNECSDITSDKQTPSPTGWTPVSWMLMQLVLVIGILQRIVLITSILWTNFLK